MIERFLPDREKDVDAFPFCAGVIIAAAALVEGAAAAMLFSGACCRWA